MAYLSFNPLFLKVHTILPKVDPETRKTSNEDTRCLATNKTYVFSEINTFRRFSNKSFVVRFPGMETKFVFNLN